MNKPNPFFILWVMFITTALSVSAQSIADELKKVRNAYITNKHLSFEVEAYSYTTKVDKTPELVSKGYMKKNNDKYYSNFNNYEFMMNGDKALIVDNESKSMTYYEYKIASKKAPQAMDVNMDSLLLSGDSVYMHPAKDGIKHFTTYSKTSYVTQTEIYVDATTNLVVHLLYYYAASTDEYDIDVDRVEVFYKNIKTQVVDEHFFSFIHYFKIVKANYIPVGKYQGYKMKYNNSKS
jgi:hypothetical protein